MMKYDERAYLPEDGGPAAPPKPMTCLDVECTECGRRWYIPVRPEWTDWKLIAEEYRKRNEHLRERVRILAAELDESRRSLAAAKAELTRLIMEKADENL